jgi:hypothetical protein
MTELLYLLELLSIILNKYPIYEHTNYMNTIYSRCDGYWVLSHAALRQREGYGGQGYGV